MSIRCSWLYISVTGIALDVTGSIIHVDGSIFNVTGSTLVHMAVFIHHCGVPLLSAPLLLFQTCHFRSLTDGPVHSAV